MVLPVTAKTNQLNHLEIGGCDTVDLVNEFGTPLFVLDKETIVSRCRRYMTSFSKGPVGMEIIYAAKAFMSLAFCQIIEREGLSIDVSSGGELFMALRAGFPADRIYMHGNNKTPEELIMALENKVGTIVVDSFDELAALDELTNGRGIRQKIFLRLTPGIKPKTHHYIQTGQIDSKFGFGIEDGVAKAAVDFAVDPSNNLDLVGFHVHIGSQIFAVESYKKSIEILINFVAETIKDSNFYPKKLNLGGGLGIQYLVDDEPTSIEDFATAIFEVAVVESEKAGIDLPELAIEPGRSIVGNAAVTLYRIGTIKEVPGVRTYISVDGGMSDNIRPMLYGATYGALVANKAGDEPRKTATIAGKHCESGDVIIKDVELPEVEVGDILCTPATGAYGFAMASNFNMQRKPAVVMVEGGKAKTIIERQTYEDLIKDQSSLDDFE